MPTSTRRRPANRPEPEPPALPFEGFEREAFELLPLEADGTASEGAEGTAPEAVDGTASEGAEGAAAAAGESRAGRAMARAEQLFEAWGPRVGRRLGWLGLAVIVALGSAGVLAASSPTPDTGFRPELTYGNDRLLAERLDSGLRDLTALGKDVDALGKETRSLLSYVTQINRPGLSTTYSAGKRTLASIAARSAELSSRFECTPWTPARTAALELVYDASLVNRWWLVCVAIGSVAPLDDSWQAMVGGSEVAMSVADGIAAHDSLAGQALEAAREGKFAAALDLLQQARYALEPTRRLAAGFAAAGRDVSTLSQWLGRIADMDMALGLLWQAMIQSNSKITAEVTAALRTVAEAQNVLPQTNAVLSIVVYELADNMIAEGIAIEQARGRFSTALDALSQNPINV